MFATLLGALPPPTGEAGGVATSADLDRRIELAVQAQEDAALEPITDGRLRDQSFGRLPTPEQAVDQWRSTQSLTQRAVKQALPGPFSVATQNWTGREGRARPESRARVSGTAGEAVAEVARALAAAGCPLIEIEETTIARLADPAQRNRFRELHERLLDGMSGTHLTLSIVGGAPDASAWDTILGLPYASLAVDLIAGPDSWNLVTRWSGERGVVAGVESGDSRDEPKEVLLWAAHYAASTQGRGGHRVGLGSAGSWANLTWEAAVRKMRLLGEAARLATMSPGEDLYRSLDPRAVSPRRAALGHDA